MVLQIMDEAGPREFARASSAKMLLAGVPLTLEQISQADAGNQLLGRPMIVIVVPFAIAGCRDPAYMVKVVVPQCIHAEPALLDRFDVTDELRLVLDHRH